MRLLFIILIVCNSCFFSNKMENNDYEYYLGKSISVFLEENKKYDELLINDDKPGLATSLLVVFPNSFTIELLPIEFKHMKQFDKNRRWDINSFKKEKISRIKIFKKGKLINDYKL